MAAQDKVRFAGREISLGGTGFSKEEVIQAVEKIHPAVRHATLDTQVQADGSTLWNFVERAGTKG